MTVKELISLLSTKNPDAHVMVWTDSEDASCPAEVNDSTWGEFRDKNRPYVKADWPDRGWHKEWNGQPVVIIG